MPEGWIVDLAGRAIVADPGGAGGALVDRRMFRGHWDSPSQSLDRRKEGCQPEGCPVKGSDFQKGFEFFKRVLTGF